MVHLQYLTLQILLLLLWGQESSSNKNGWQYQVLEPKTLTKTTYKITVDVSSSLNKCDPRFLSVTMGPKSLTAQKWPDKVISLASELLPSDLRIGGTAANFLHFKTDGTVDQTDKQNDSNREELGSNQTAPDMVNTTFTGAQWKYYTDSIAKIGWDILFDVNLFFWRKDGLWDSTNAELFLDYSASKGIKIPYFQLGNEPNAFWGNFKINITAEMLVENYKILKKVLSKYPMYKSSKLCGPEVTNISPRGGAKGYYKKFVDAGAYDVVDEYSSHHYYLDGDTATLADFLSVATLDSLKPMFTLIKDIVSASPRPLPHRLTETASCYGGGATGLSDSYVAGFLWLDKLGLCAQNGITRVFRQTFTSGASYALVTYKDDPSPDYYLSVLFKRLTEGPVFNISFSPSNEKLRVYAHCARQGLYSPGALTIYFLNLDDLDNVLSLTQFPDADLDLYLLTPGDAAGLKSKYVKLNGKKLNMPGTEVPPLPAQPHKGDVTVAAQSFGFIVVPHAAVELCYNLHPSSSNQIVPDRTFFIALVALLLLL